MSRECREATFHGIVSICREATGSNAAFDPRFGVDTLNQIRLELNLPKVDKAEMVRLLTEN